MFVPKRYLFEKKALDYPLGKELYERLSAENKNVTVLNSSRAVLEKLTSQEEKYHYGKETLIFGVRSTLNFMNCRPSAHYQMPLVTGCMGRCEYCYLNTQLGDKPYIRTYVNIDDILNRAKEYIEERGKFTIFEGASTSDPLPVEPYTHGLERAIKFFAKEEKGHFRFVTKYHNVDSLLNIEHNDHTDIRFSINSDYVINNYEHYTSRLDQRLTAAKKIGDSGYQLGFIIAPVFIYDNWEQDYQVLIDKLNNFFNGFNKKITFEVISHRYTLRAKDKIQAVFPETTLPMIEEDRKFKFGQFGYGKYVYKPDDITLIEEFFQAKLSNMNFETEIKYII